MSDRYVVFDVGCLECSDSSSADPKIVFRTDDLAAALESKAVTDRQGDADRFVFDTDKMEIVGESS